MREVAWVVFDEIHYMQVRFGGHHLVTWYRQGRCRSTLMCRMAWAALRLSQQYNEGKECGCIAEGLGADLGPI